MGFRLWAVGIRDIEGLNYWGIGLIGAYYTNIDKRVSCKSSVSSILSF